MSALYSTIAFGASVAVAAGNAPGAVSYAPRQEGRTALVFGVFNALGTIMFAFGGHAILLEVQVRAWVPLSEACMRMAHNLRIAFEIWPVGSVGSGEQVVLLLCMRHGVGQACIVPGAANHRTTSRERSGIQR